MFGGEYRIPTDIIFSTEKNNTLCSAILMKVKYMKEIATEYIQISKAASYCVREIKYNILKKEDLVVVLLLRNVKQ